MSRSRFMIEDVTDPAEVSRFRAQDEWARRNSEWLQAHWAEIVPGARGKFLAVAGQQAYVAATPEEARALATAAHPEDDGIIEQYVRAERGPRLYANRR